MSRGGSPPSSSGASQQHLTAQMHAAVASALGDLHQELANTIGDAIRDALAKRQLK
jgi:hypothetical protein